jgi:pimeloyl-ACP methyl ester carboxylesterase
MFQYSRALLCFAAFPASLALAASKSECSRAADRIAIANTTLLDTSYHRQGEVIPLPGTVESCGGPTLNATITANLCRFVLSTATSSTSAVHIEAWLPDDWNGRLIATGGGGLGGCIDYSTVQNAASLGFASFGMNSGHDGSEGISYFLNKPEVIIDFGYRSMHTEAAIGKELSKLYYGHPTKFNYYVGCSTGGRQGLSSATHYPEDFHGMVIGAAGVEWIRIVTQWYLQAQRYGWPNVHTAEYVTFQQFEAIAEKTIELFDQLDGVKNDIIDYTTHLRFDPQVFACGYGILNDSVCLRNSKQVESVRLAYEPMVDLRGHFVYPNYQIGATTSSFADNEVNGTGHMSFPQVRDYFRGIVYNDSNWDDSTLTIADVEFAVKLNVGLTNTGIGEAQMGAFKGSGGKIISYHGRFDPTVPSELSEWYYNGASANMNASLDDMLDFYRLFFIPGMGHCSTGPGAWNIGQTYPLDPHMLDAKHNTIMALVDWVEHGRAPNELIGTKYENDDVSSKITAQRSKLKESRDPEKFLMHLGSEYCVYPEQSVWNGGGSPSKESSWKCEKRAGY